MKNSIKYFQEYLHTAFSMHFGQESPYTSLQEIPLPADDQLRSLIEQDLTRSERIVFLLALMPHISPQSLDLFFIQNKELNRPYTEFGGWTGIVHRGFLPTVQTAIFLLTVEGKQDENRWQHLFKADHWFYNQNILRLKGPSLNEPFASSKLCVSKAFLEKL